MKALLWVIFIFGGFLLGSIYFSNFIVKSVAKKSVFSASDDGNPGAANAWKLCGPKWGFLCFFLDFAKGFVPVLIATFVVDTANILFSFVVAAPVLGHAVGIFNNFQGGKCISVSFGAMFGTLTVTWGGLFLLAGYVLFCLILHVKPNGIMSICSFTSFGIAGAIFYGIRGEISYLLACVFVAVIADVRHLMKIRQEIASYKEKKLASGFGQQEAPEFPAEEDDEEEQEGTTGGRCC